MLSAASEADGFGSSFKEKAWKVTRNTINARNYNVVVDDQANDVFAFNGTTITIKALSFVGNIQTTGTITLSNNEIGRAHV